jgi:hypothetical protein
MRASDVSKQGSLEFRNEVLLLSRLHHRHLVRLEGFCDDRGLQAKYFSDSLDIKLRSMILLEFGICRAGPRHSSLELYLVSSIQRIQCIQANDLYLSSFADSCL